MIVRLATEADIPALRELIQLSARELGVGYYSADQTEGALMGAFGVDSQLIADETYFVVDGGGVLAAAGGWSFRAAPFGGDAMGNAVSERLDPLLEPARIRAFFTHPAFARRGLARQLLAHCEVAATAAGFRRFQLTATLPGGPFYLSQGYRELDHQSFNLPNGAKIGFVAMIKDGLAGSP
jgi:GNAT superfamily N-acetyltransferase